ncbi:MAG: hypothetical protein J5680_06380 [Neisseriaceae bacterium]|nr:hypothetical protein [Neisseriaceae bacterium]
MKGYSNIIQKYHLKCYFWATINGLVVSISILQWKDLRRKSNLLSINAVQNFLLGVCAFCRF